MHCCRKLLNILWKRKIRNETVRKIRNYVNCVLIPAIFRTTSRNEIKLTFSGHICYYQEAWNVRTQHHGRKSWSEKRTRGNRGGTGRMPLTVGLEVEGIGQGQDGFFSLFYMDRKDYRTCVWDPRPNELKREAKWIGRNSKARYTTVSFHGLTQNSKIQKTQNVTKASIAKFNVFRRLPWRDPKSKCGDIRETMSPIW